MGNKRLKTGESKLFQKGAQRNPVVHFCKNNCIYEKNHSVLFDHHYVINGIRTAVLYADRRKSMVLR